MRIILAVAILAGISSLAAPQSMTATTGSTAPPATAPSSATFPKSQPKGEIKPPAYMGKSGLRVGNDATDAGPVEIKRNK
jgi:hypothetical protein